MTKKTRFTLLIMLIFAILSSFTLTACTKTTEYKLYSYTFYGDTYNIGDSFFGVEIKSDLVSLKLTNGELELKISQGFINGDPEMVDEYTSYAGTYTETDSTITAIIPNFSTGSLSIMKAGNKFSFNLSSSITIILQK